nr:YdcF family protein [Clostridiales bacterium]
YDTLVEKGIDKERIILEEKSTNTYENFVYSKRLIESIEEGKSINNFEVAFVSSDYHILRAFAIAYKAGIHVRCISAKSPLNKLFKNYLREYLAFYPLIFNKLDVNNIEADDE